MTDLSIILPIYNVEKYVRSSLESIFKQGLDEDKFEVIIVNDGTKDKSMEMIEDIILQHTNISVINQDNLSLSVARNNGIKDACGEYIIMPDSDDLLVEGAIPPLIKKAIDTKVDLLVADFLETDDKGAEELIKNPPKQPFIDFKEKTGEELLLEDLNPRQCYVWRTLYRREFILKEHLLFVPGIRFQDVPFTHECYIKAKKCIRANRLLNIYRRGHESATYSFNISKCEDFCIAIHKTWELTQLKGLSTNIHKRLKDDVFTSTSVLAYTISHNINDRKERKKATIILKRLLSTISFNKGVKEFLLTFSLRNFPHTYISFRRLYGYYIEDRAKYSYKH